MIYLIRSRGIGFLNILRVNLETNTPNHLKALFVRNIFNFIAGVT